MLVIVGVTATGEKERVALSDGALGLRAALDESTFATVGHRARARATAFCYTPVLANPSTGHNRFKEK
ncbi:hypothetical protein WT83_16555 [Burkholderia territorii]|uniref:Uncharacterized protein n=1 Tax=Burkholderia territorii TaxID=1503055 RepID=A0A125K6T5_9BURK|nr:hypothetical protein [Burkholderia territorii]KWN14702.1 hypothetical protein WT83_16555 [Burkholderia territorii]